MLSFDAWNGAAVAPTIHSLTVLPAKAGAKSEAVSANLFASLAHPDRKALIWTVAFSPDGKRLFASGYPSGVVQIFDLASLDELIRIETPPGLRGSPEYALLTPDWKSIYVPTERRKVHEFEQNGKRAYCIELSGEIRVWDVQTGKEKEPLLPAKGTQPLSAKLTPDGRQLLCVERSSYDSTNPDVPDIAVAWDLASRTKRTLRQRYLSPRFSPDGKTIFTSESDIKTKKSAVLSIDLATGKELGRLECPESDRDFSLNSVSSDGTIIAVTLAGKKGAPLETWFLDARTLGLLGKLIGKAVPNSFPRGSGRFSPDGKRFVLLDTSGYGMVWDVAEQKLERTFSLGENLKTWWTAISPDGKTLAAVWIVKPDPTEELSGDPEPSDFPQPHISLVDLTGRSPIRVLIAPNGNTGNIAFSPDGKTLAFGSSGVVRLFDLTK